MGILFKSVLAIAAACLLLAGCASPTIQPSQDLTKFNSEKPRSILVVPVANRSTAVEAPDGMLVTLAVPLAERGFYVFPTHMVRRTMEDDGIGDADLVQQADPQRLASLFGADAILYTTIEKWDAQYLVLATSTTVTANYVLKSGKTGETLWERRVERCYSTTRTTAVGASRGSLSVQSWRLLSGLLRRTMPWHRKPVPQR
jgi:hypothetical protein